MLIENFKWEKFYFLKLLSESVYIHQQKYNKCRTFSNRRSDVSHSKLDPEPDLVQMLHVLVSVQPAELLQILHVGGSESCRKFDLFRGSKCSSDSDHKLVIILVKYQHFLLRSFSLITCKEEDKVRNRLKHIRD